MKFWPRWISDWRGDTLRLTLQQRGAYGELLDELYSSEAPLPLDPQECYRIAGARSPSEYRDVDMVLAKFFTRTEQGFEHGRATKEIAKYYSLKKRRQHATDERWKNHAPTAPLKGNGAHEPAPDQSPIIEHIPLVGGEEWPVHQSLADELTRLYPNVDVPATLRQIRGWCIGNPQKLKTARGVKRFITAWCDRDQNKA